MSSAWAFAENVLGSARASRSEATSSAWAFVANMAGSARDRRSEAMSSAWAFAENSCIGSASTGRSAARATREPNRSSKADELARSDSARAANSASRLSRDGLTASAAAVGVEARRSETISAMEVSTSCPMPVTTGTGHAATARARPSSLNGIMSSNEPPPRTTSTTCAPAATTQRSPSTMPAGALAPSTGTPASSTRATG